MSMEEIEAEYIKALTKEEKEILKQRVNRFIDKLDGHELDSFTYGILKSSKKGKT